jgi:hypothetical protein
MLAAGRPRFLVGTKYMALVVRGTKTYYYKSYRTGGRVSSRFAGSGEVAEAYAWLHSFYRERDARDRARHARRMARLEAMKRRLRRRFRRDWLRDRESAEAADALLASWHGQVEVIFLGAMAAAGCHEHKRTWRKKRMNSKERSEAEKEFAAYWARVEAGDPALREDVQRLFGLSGEEASRVWGGDLAARVVEGLTDRLAGRHLYKREALARKLAAVRADMEGADPSPAVRLLAERAAVSWLAAYEADLTCERFGALAGAKVAAFYQRRQDAAQRRYLRAVRELEVVRKLTAPRYRPKVDFGGRLAGAVAAGRN